MKQFNVEYIHKVVHINRMYLAITNAFTFLISTKVQQYKTVKSLFFLFMVAFTGAVVHLVRK